MLALNLYVCDKCGKVLQNAKHFENYSFCLRCFAITWNNNIAHPDAIKNLEQMKKEQSIEVAKNKKILDIILADAKNKIKEQFGVEV